MNLLAIDLNLLLVFDAVIAERSVGRAAKRLHVTPPAISNALNRLRDAIGDPIVTRSGRGIVPTPRALQLAPAIARALRDIDTALHGDAFDPHAPLQLTLAIADAGQLARLPRLSALLATELPRARLRVVSVDTMLALGGLAGTEVDVAIGVSDPAPGIHRTAIYEERTVLVARRDHPRLGERVTTRALSAERHVDVNIAFDTPSRHVVRGFAQAKVARDIALVVPTFTAAAAIVAATDYIAAMPQSVVDSLAFPLRVLRSPVRFAPLPMQLSWHERTHADAAQKSFRSLIARALAPEPRGRQ